MYLHWTDNFPPLPLEEIITPIERTLKASTSNDHKAMVQTLRSNIGTIVGQWAAASSRATFMRGSEVQSPDQEREDRLRTFLGALLDRVQDPTDKMALEALKTAIRSEHARSLSLSTFVKRQSLLRDVMYDVLVKDMPELPKTTAKLAVDAIVDRSIEGTVLMFEEYSVLQSTLSRWMLSAALDNISIDESLSRFCRGMMDYFDVEFVAVLRSDSDSKQLTVKACVAKGLALAKDTTIQTKSMSLAVAALDKKKPIASEAGKEKSKKGKVMGQISYMYNLAIPMIQEDRAVGLLFMGDNARPGNFTVDEVSVAEDLTKQLVRMLENTELFEKLSIRSKAQKVLIETAAQLQQEIGSEEIYRIVAMSLDDLIPSDEFAFYVYDWKRRVGNPVYATGPYASETMADMNFPTDIGIAGYVARTKKAEIIADTETDPRGESIPGTPALHTRMLAVPVVGQKEVIGVIELLRYPPGEFTQEDLEIATMFANHASTALENATLLKEVKGVRDQLEVSIDLLTHDIANYTTPINAYFSELKKRDDLDDEVATAVSKTARQVESVMRLVEMVRTMTKLRDAASSPLKSMDLRTAVEEAVSYVRESIQTKRIEFEMSFPADSMNVKADELLKDLFASLFFSAAMSDRQDKTKFTVTAETRKDNKVEYWLVKVSQHGRAIPDNIKGEVLKLTKASKSELGGGFGIGLATARDIVDKYSGGMWVSDIRPGEFAKGCVFNIALPKAR